MADDVKLVYATSTLIAEHGGRPVHTTAGEAWAADDPFVRANPHLFGAASAPRRTTPARAESTARRGPAPTSGRVTR